MKALLILSLLLSGLLTVTAAAVGAAEAAPQELQELQEQSQFEDAEVAPQEQQEDNQLVGDEDAVFVPEGRFFACPTGWVRYKTSCYLFVSSSRSWSSAVAHCASLGASLASAHDVFDYSFLQELTRRNGYTQCWMGGFYFQGWRWVDESTFSYSYWNSLNSVSSYPCIHLNSRAGWSNAVCTATLPQICVKRTDSC